MQVRDGWTLVIGCSQCSTSHSATMGRWEADRPCVCHQNQDPQAEDLALRAQVAVEEQRDRASPGPSLRSFLEVLVPSCSPRLRTCSEILLVLGAGEGLVYDHSLFHAHTHSRVLASDQVIVLSWP